LVVEERSAKSGLEEVVLQRVAAGDLRQWQLRRVVVAHREPLRVRRGGELVVATTVDLDLVLVVAVHQVDRHLVERQVVVDREWGVREVAVEGISLRHAAGVGRKRWRGEVGVHLGQALQRLAAQVHLPGVSDVRVLQPIGAGEGAVQVVERVVLEIDHHEVLDVAERWALGLRAGSRRCQDDGQRARDA